MMQGKDATNAKKSQQTQGWKQCVFLRSGFLQVRENWKKVSKFEWSGKGREKIFFGGKSQGNEKLVPPDVRFSC